ncbi:MAG TPA: hypothetical protein VI757_11860 [Bacteroidia bacterium]|nr:hypothetical protein [Bacteroidia bacterium]
MKEGLLKFLAALGFTIAADTKEKDITLTAEHVDKMNALVAERDTLKATSSTLEGEKTALTGEKATLAADKTRLEGELAAEKAVHVVTTNAFEAFKKGDGAKGTNVKNKKETTAGGEGKELTSWEAKAARMREMHARRSDVVIEEDDDETV